MGSKFATGKGDRTDLYLKDAAIHARNIAKQYNCVIMWMSQLSAAAEGLTSPDKSMIEGSKTGLAAEADLMLLIARNKINKGDFAGEEQEDLESNERHINVDKNKLKGGWHGRITCQLDGDRSQYLP
jgi:hypothetical protein